MNPELLYQPQAYAILSAQQPLLPPSGAIKTTVEIDTPPIPDQLRKPVQPVPTLTAKNYNL